MWGNIEMMTMMVMVMTVVMRMKTDDDDGGDEDEDNTKDNYHFHYQSKLLSKSCASSCNNQLPMQSMIQFNSRKKDEIHFAIWTNTICIVAMQSTIQFNSR